MDSDSDCTRHQPLREPSASFALAYADALDAERRQYQPPPPPNPQILLILIGLPGSGKTTLAEALVRYNYEGSTDEIASRPGPGSGLAFGSAPGPSATPFSTSRRWVRASQDDAPSRRRQECEAAVREGLMAGCNVVVDRVGFDPVQRSHFIALAHSLPLPPIRIYALTLFVSPLTLSSRLQARPSHPTLTSPELALSVLGQMTAVFDPPRPGREEGFVRVLEIREADQPKGGKWTRQGVRKLVDDFERFGHVESGVMFRPRVGQGGRGSQSWRDRQGQ